MSRDFPGGQWLRLHTGNVGDSDLIPGKGTSHEIKRRLLTNLDSIFKSRDITLPTKVGLLKAMVFPLVMYGCETWTVKKAER